MIRRILTLATLALGLVSAQAQALSDAQRTTVRNFACADTATARPMVLAGNITGLQSWLNTAGTFIVWRTNVTNDELGDAMNGTEVAGLSSLNMQRLQVLAAYSGGNQNMARADRRSAFDAVFSGAGGATTRASMAVLWKRSALRVEQALGSGTGTTAVPGLTTVEGPLGDTDAARMLFTEAGQQLGC